jgi:poly(hydroxyalkanoate) depolymerase family esterase
MPVLPIHVSPRLDLARFAALFLALALLVPSGHAQAASGSLDHVTGFGSNAGNLTMHAFVPDDLPADAALVVALHGCTQSASAYHSHSGWSELAEENGFAVVYPQTSSANNANSCFNWFEPADTGRGQGEALSIRQMVAHAVSSYDLDPDRVFVTGLSAGGAMAATMLAAYPDVFAGGSVVAGIAHGCATSVSQAFTCMYAPPNRTPDAWGDLVRAAHPGYDGPRPGVSIWHGTADTTVRPAMAQETRDQFTDVAGVGQHPTATESLPGGATMTEYGDGAVRMYLVEAMAHGTPVDPGDGCGSAGAYFLDTLCSAAYDAVSFGIADGPGDGDPDPDPDPDPEPTCVTTSNYTHVAEGRAYVAGGYAFALGSGDPMGLWNLWQSTSLLQTGPDHWEVGC